jgi:hypothetical protein
LEYTKSGAQKQDTHPHYPFRRPLFGYTGAKFFIPVAVFWIQALNGAWMTSSCDGVDWIIGQYLEMRLSSYELFIY